MYEPSANWWPTRRCYMCRRVHAPERWATVVLVSPIAKIPIDVHLCSQRCADNLVFDYPAEVDEGRRALAIKEMIEGE